MDARRLATLIVVVPAAFLFASVMVAIGAMARSFKEAQTLLTPVYFLCITPSLIAGLGRVGARRRRGDRARRQRHAAARAIWCSARRRSARRCWSSRARWPTARWRSALAARLYDSERLLAADEAALGLARLAAPARGLGGGAPATAPTRRDVPTPGHALALFGVGVRADVLRLRPAAVAASRAGLALSEWGGMLGLVALYARGTGQRLPDGAAPRAPARARAAWARC